MNEKTLLLINEIGSLAMLRIERWRDKFGAWRAGIEWYGEEDYLFICEYPTLLECLECIIEHRAEWEHKVPKLPIS